MVSQPGTRKRRRLPGLVTISGVLVVIYFRPVWHQIWLVRKDSREPTEAIEKKAWIQIQAGVVLFQGWPLSHKEGNSFWDMSALSLSFSWQVSYFFTSETPGCFQTLCKKNIGNPGFRLNLWSLYCEVEFTRILTDR